MLRLFDPLKQFAGSLTKSMLRLLDPPTQTVCHTLCSDSSCSCSSKLLGAGCKLFANVFLVCQKIVWCVFLIKLFEFLRSTLQTLCQFVLGCKKTLWQLDLLKQYARLSAQRCRGSLTKLACAQTLCSRQTVCQTVYQTVCQTLRTEKSRVTYQISMCRLFAHVIQFVRLFTQTGSLKQFGKLYRQTVRCRDCIKLFGKLSRQTVRCRDCIKLFGKLYRQTVRCRDCIKLFGKLYRQTVRCRDCIKLFGKLYRQTVRCRDCIKLLGPPCKLSANLF